MKKGIAALIVGSVGCVSLSAVAVLLKCPDVLWALIIVAVMVNDLKSK